ncbi:MAG: hypothetical protein LBE18_08140 [Planctomycetaceae bacterium]|jgi:hypothetical protein|nr:hypothetical protein [Planctomycetaceae bacterium]
MKSLASFLLLTIFISSAGCRMCGTDYDYCMPAIVEGGVQNAGPLYRAGSILNGISGNYCNDKYFTDQNCNNCNSFNSNIPFNFTEDDNDNTINTEKKYLTSPQKISPNVPDDLSETSNGNGWQGTNIGIPKNPPPNNGNGDNNNIPETFDQTPTVTPSLEELMKPTPPRPKTTPKNTPSPNTPNFTNSGMDNFTLENIRQLDPSVNNPDVYEVKIIKIEDTTSKRR